MKTGAAVNNPWTINTFNYTLEDKPQVIDDDLTSFKTEGEQPTVIDDDLTSFWAKPTGIVLMLTALAAGLSLVTWGIVKVLKIKN